MTEGWERGSAMRARREPPTLVDIAIAVIWYGGVVVLNGILFMILIEVLRSLGWWDASGMVGPIGGSASPDASVVAAASTGGGSLQAQLTGARRASGSRKASHRRGGAHGNPSHCDEGSS